MATQQSNQTKATNNLAVRIGTVLNKHRVNYNLAKYFDERMKTSTTS